MTELESRVHASGIVQALRERGQNPEEIHVEPNGAGLTVRVAFPCDNPVAAHGPVAEVHIAPGYYAYGQVADSLIHDAGLAVLESD